MICLHDSLTANVQEFASKTMIIIYRARALTTEHLSVPFFFFSFSPAMFIWGLVDFICVRVWRLSWQRRHI